VRGEFGPVTRRPERIRCQLGQTGDQWDDVDGLELVFELDL